LIKNLQEKAKNAKQAGNMLIFVYYSGHGTIDSTGMTCGIALLDCCREQRKGIGLHQPQINKIKGQLSLIHAVDAGKSAVIATGATNSMVTEKFLQLMNRTTETYPQCIV